MVGWRRPSSVGRGDGLGLLGPGVAEEGELHHDPQAPATTTGRVG